MAHAGIQIFMEKLNHLINSNNIPFFNHLRIKRERPQFQLLYEDLGSMIQPLLIDEYQDLHDLEKLNDLRKRYIDAAEEAEYIVDLFLSGVHIRNDGHFPKSKDLKRSLNLDDVRRSFKSVELEFMSMRRPQTTLNQSTAAQISISRNSQGSKEVLDEIFVGLDVDAKLIIDKLTANQNTLDVVSIVGMGGIGKTTLATKVFNDGYVKHHFYVRIWVIVSQTYDKRDVLIQILSSIRGQLDLGKASDSELSQMVHKHLMGKKYLIVMDDIWDIGTWDKLKSIFPRQNAYGKILLTSRVMEVAKHASLNGHIHHLECLNKEKSWELLCKKVFRGNQCPEWSSKPGMQIVESCQGLPLAVVVIAGVLANEARNENFWVEFADKASSYIVGDKNGCLETLALSYDHLPPHLRECFMYLGGFPEDYMFQVQRLIWLWVAEGFIQQAGNQSLEDIADIYLRDLIDRNLVMAADRKSNGNVKACKVHDLVRELCLKKAKEEQFFLKLERPVSNQFPKDTTPPKLSYQFSEVATPLKPVRTFTNKDIELIDIDNLSIQNLRSLLWFGNFTSLSDDIAKYFRSFVLLRVLDLHDCRLHDFPYAMKLLVHLRYLAFWNSSPGFPDSICNLWSLQTLICISYDRTVLPSNISDLVNLRHLWSYLPYTNEAVGIWSLETPFFLPTIEKPMNLQTISNVELGDGVDNFQKCFPYIKELTCTTRFEKENDFKPLTDLETLKLTALHKTKRSTVHDTPKGESICRKNHITFPTTLKTLTLVLCRLPWSDMSILQSLPNLEVLKLRQNAFEGSCWNTNEQVFPQLKVLRLERLNIKLWEAYSPSFPCLRQLKVFNCLDLEAIPLEIWEVSTLEIIKIKDCGPSVGESVGRIQEEQQYNWGRCDLKIDVSMEIPISF